MNIGHYAFPDDMTISGYLQFRCKSCETEVSANFDSQDIDDLSQHLDDDHEYRCPDCLEQYRRESAEESAIDDQITSYRDLS